MSFTWKPFFHEIFLKVVNEYDARSLAELIYELFPENAMMDTDKKDNKVQFKEFEPCSFLARFNRSEILSKRIEYCRKAKEVMDLKSEIPKDFDGIPVFNNMRWMLFPFTKDRKGFEIEALWALAKEISKGEMTSTGLNKASESFGAGLTYLTTVAYIVCPEKYLPLDERTKSFLLKRDSDFEEMIDSAKKATEPFVLYQNILKKVADVIPKKSFSEISLSAYMEDVGEESGKEVNYWVVGATWGDADKSAEFLKSNVWINGYDPDSGDKSIEKVKSVQVGDWIAIKSAFTKEKKISTVRIKGVGVVTENVGDGKHLKVDWKFTGTPFDVEGAAYMQTIHKVTDREDQRLIFKNSYKTVRKSKPSNDDVDLDVGVTTMSKNTIYWGPPGTGKTYRLLQLQKEFRDIASSGDEIVTWVQELGWWEVIASAMIDIGKPVSVPDLFEHEFVQAKVKQSSNKTPKNTLWGLLQLHTIRDSKTVNFERRQEPLVVDKLQDSNWQLVGDWKDQLDDLVADVKRIRTGKGTATSERFNVVTFHQSYSYEEFVEGIRPEIQADGSGVSYQVKDGVFKKLCQRALENPEKKYAIFIDEINRGNISKIFGELITLIEEDKRLGAPHEVTITLPYSGQKFGVPNNLYVIGTMNSVDRSIALVDMALRRRFDFIAIRPDSSLISNDRIKEFNVRSVFEKLNNKISVILGTEYQVGHSYFMDKNTNSLQSFKRVWFGSILPLLQEYLFDDWDKLHALVGDFVRKTDVKDLESLSLPKFSFGSFVENDISDNAFVEIIKKLE